MRKISLYVAFLSCLILISCSGNKEEQAVKALAKRIIPEFAGDFKFDIQTPEAEEDFFTIEQKGQKILITGNNANSLAAGLNYYLQNYANVYISWYEDDDIVLPEIMPTVTEKIEKKAVVKDRFFFNYCTYGYTMPWWQWDEWEHCIDWMALNGINMPLAITGQESVWYEVWKEFGMTDEEIRSYFTGPAHLPWHRMANVDSFDGPLPKSWLEGQTALQKKILKRERALSMTPVLPAFAGHVPQYIHDKFPDADIKTLGPWCGFDVTYFLNSQEPLFSEIQKSFIEKQTELFGTDHVYGFDPFNEMTPPSWENDYLATVSENIYASLQSVDTDATWLQMGWLFFNQRRNWTKERIQSYLTAVPQDKLIMLDYFCERIEIWRNTEAFFGQPFVWCYLGNFGGNTMLVGDIPVLEKKLTAALNEAGDNFVGIGSTLESFDNSPQIFEYLFDRVWEQEGINTDAWIEKWAELRYGGKNEYATEAWRLLNDSIYKDWSNYGLGTQLNARPTLEGHGTYYTKPYYSYSNDNLRTAIELLLKEPSLRQTYQYDIANLMSIYLGNYFLDVRNDFTVAYKNKDIEAMKTAVDKAMEIFDATDDILATNDNFLLGKWIKDAREWGETEEEKDYYEKNARTLLTVWGGPVLNDYANRTWNGLVSGYYKQRWTKFFDAVTQSVENGTEFDDKSFYADLGVWEQQWSTADTMQYPSEGEGNAAEIAVRILKNL